MTYQHRKRADANQAAIVAALRQVGAKVQVLSQVGHGCPDLLIYHHGRLRLLEVKSGSEILSVEERAWHDGWPDAAAVVRSVPEALAVLGVILP